MSKCVSPSVRVLFVSVFLHYERSQKLPFILSAGANKTWTVHTLDAYTGGMRSPNGPVSCSTFIQPLVFNTRESRDGQNCNRMGNDEISDESKSRRKEEMGGTETKRDGKIEGREDTSRCCTARRRVLAEVCRRVLPILCSFWLYVDRAAPSPAPSQVSSSNY